MKLSSAKNARYRRKKMGEMQYRGGNIRLDAIENPGLQSTVSGVVHSSFYSGADVMGKFLENLRSDWKANLLSSQTKSLGPREDGKQLTSLEAKRIKAVRFAKTRKNRLAWDLLKNTYRFNRPLTEKECDAILKIKADQEAWWAKNKSG